MRKKPSVDVKDAYKLMLEMVKIIANNKATTTDTRVNERQYVCKNEKGRCANSHL